MICPERIRPTYEWHTTVATVDVGPDRLLTPTAQLRMQQEVGELHFGEGGLGFANIATLGMAFLLCQNNAVIYRRPAACEAVTVKTWSHSVKGIRFFRCYRFEDADGNTLIDSTASFVLVDVNTHSLIRPKNFPYAITHCPDIPHTCPMPPTLKMAEEIQRHSIVSLLSYPLEWKNTVLSYGNIFVLCVHITVIKPRYSLC